MHVRRVCAAKYGQRGVAIARRYIAEHLIVGAVFADGEEDMLDQRWIANPGRDGDRFLKTAAAARGLDILPPVPVVVLIHLLGPRLQRLPIRQRHDAYVAVVLAAV